MKVHTGETPFQCSHCDKAWSKQSDLKTHLRTHSGEKSYQFSQCDKAFKKQ